jgi:peptidylamidoglycolate lyase
MRVNRGVFVAGVAVIVARSFALVAGDDAIRAQRAPMKGGDDRNGAYDAVPNWWKPAPEHDTVWTWGEVSGLAADTPDRIIVAVWGDRNRQNQERPGGTNYLVVVNRNGDIIERWQQWDSILNKPHQVYISPYDPERHVWIVERGGGRNVHMSILKFSNDGKRLVMQLGDGVDPRDRAEARANPKPGPFDYGDPACLAFLPDGFLLADGYWNSRVVKYNAKGEYVMEWGSLGTGPGQFDLVHGVAVDRARRVYVADRTNNRLQVFTEDGRFIEQWPDITDPVGVYVDENESVWVVSAALNRILKYNRDGVLQYHWGAYGGTRGGFVGGLSRPHQIDVDQEGNVYIASWDGGWVTKYIPKPGADPNKLVGRKLVLSHQVGLKDAHQPR